MKKLMALATAAAALPLFSGCVAWMNQEKAKADVVVKDRVLLVCLVPVYYGHTEVPAVQEDVIDVAVPSCAGEKAAEKK